MCYNLTMIKKIATKYKLNEVSNNNLELQYWLSRPSHERISAVENLRRQFYGSSARLQRTARVVQRSQS